jgi:hypothetical protein
MRPLGAVAALAVTAVAIGACGTSGAATEARATAKKTFAVSGTVARVCPGPIVAGRAPRCSDGAVFARTGKHWTVHGRFTVRLPRGTYEVTIDNCAVKRRVTVTHRISGLKLAPRCAIPL